ncbi:MAG TPA: hypothetical protein VLL52_15520 [Anaerolineae bacterium]|nr:hypothetical protein [Anaerolineae bacterium]
MVLKYSKALFMALFLLVGISVSSAYAFVPEHLPGQGGVKVIDVERHPQGETQRMPSPAEACGDITTTTLYAGQHINSGSVTIWNDADTLYVQFATVDGWTMVETHVHVGETLADVPTTPAGNPKIGLFDYQTQHDPAVTEFTYEIPLDGFVGGDSLVVAAHASLALVDDNGDVIQTETGWADGPDFPGNSWATYVEFTVQECEEEDDDGGCSLTQGYWRTHSTYGPAPYDETWATVGEDTAFFSSPETWYSALWVSPEGDAYYILAQQYIAATLNVNGGTSTTADVDAALSLATNWFNSHDPGVPASSADGQVAVALSEILDAYNNGEIGPGHCD